MSTQAVHTLTERYGLALQGYFEGGGEASLLQAYQIGRDALERRMDVLQLAAIHQEALVAMLLRMLSPEVNARIAQKASELFVESLAPFEMSQRSTQEANALLQNLNRSLERRVNERTAELEKALAQVSEHERIEQMKDEFVALVSHELRTPLTSIHGSLDLIRSGSVGAVSPDVASFVEIAHRNSQHLVRLVSGILDVEKIASGRMMLNLQVISPLPLAEQAIEANRAYAGQFDVALELDSSAGDARVKVDPDRLLQVMTNLLSNAAKFSPPGETVRVSLSRGGGAVRVSVTDHGPGIPVHFRPRIFQKFAHAAPSGLPQRGGTGLGLAIAKAIVESLGGRIGFETETNVGTTFYFDLPEHQDQEPSGSGTVACHAGS